MTDRLVERTLVKAAEYLSRSAMLIDTLDKISLNGWDASVSGVAEVSRSHSNLLRKAADDINGGEMARPEKAAIIKITKENAGPLAEAALSGYIGEKCEFCGEVFEGLEDLEDTVVSSTDPDFRIAHRACFQEVHGG